MASLWPLGVALELLATLLCTIGKQLVRFSERYKAAGRRTASRASLTIGLAVNTVVGPVLDLCAYAFAPQTVLAPFGGLDVVWNTLVAPCTLGEQLTAQRVGGVVLIFIGTILSIIEAEHEEPEYTAEYLEDKLLRWRTLVYAIVFIGWLLLNFLCLMNRPRGTIARGFSLGATGGTIAGNMFCVKAVAELVKTCIQEGTMEPWTHWISYALLVGAVFFAVSNVTLVTKGLKEYETLFMVPVFEGSMVVSNALSAVVIMGELDSARPLRHVLYGASIATVSLGMVVLVTAEDTFSLTTATESGEGSDSSEADETFFD